MSRIPGIPDEEASGEVKQFYGSVEKMLGRVPNSWRVMAHAPFHARVLLPFTVTLMREGLGSVLTTKLKEMAVIKTSQVNGCDY